MKKRNAFNFVELMLVMGVLGMIMGLTIPILTSLKDDKDIYRAYMKKANQDVTDMTSMALIKNRLIGFKGFNSVDSSVTTRSTGRPSFPGGISEKIRIIYNTTIKGTPCGLETDNLKSCLCDNRVHADDCEDMFDFAPEGGAGLGTNPTDDTPGLKLPGKVVMLFTAEEIAEDNGRPKGYGFVFVDMNGSKGPNILCQDRYKFQIYKNSAAMVDCNLEINFD